MKQLRLRAPKGPLKGSIQLPTSKSIANRYLLIRALAKDSFVIGNLPDSDDTQLLNNLLSSDAEIYDAHHAGTTSRFLAVYLAFKEGKQILTGSDRLKQRPIKPLIDALISLGASVEYMEEDGCLPISFDSTKSSNTSKISIDGSVSSQFISALLMLAPSLAQGLNIEVKGKLVSESYVEMTIHILESFGIQVDRSASGFAIKPQSFATKDVIVEADWSAASYYFGLCSVFPASELVLMGLSENSIQGDAALLKIYKKLGVHASFEEGGLLLTQSGSPAPMLDYDFSDCPDIFQTVSLSTALLGIQGLYTGLSTLAHKETDRTQAIKTEIAKLGVALYKMPPHFSPKSNKEYFMQEGKAKETESLEFPSYQDHRMAMSLSQVAKLQTITILEPNVVTKSYPRFWDDLSQLGFSIEYS